MKRDNLYRFRSAGRLLLLLLTACFFLSCSTIRFIPDGQYLLDKIDIRLDSGAVSKAELAGYIQQKPNDPKLGLKIYNMVDNDSNWFKKMIRKLGEPPQIYNPNLVTRSVNELSIQMKNLGYLNSTVEAVVDTAKKRATVNYHIHEGTPYRIRSYEIRLADTLMTSIARGVRPVRQANDTTYSQSPNTNRSRRNPLRRRRTTSLLKEGGIFDLNILEQERTRISNRLRNSGYYTSTPDNLHYLADTTLRSNQVDLTLIHQDSTRNRVYRIADVKVFSGYDPFDPAGYRIRDSLQVGDLWIYYDNMHFLRPNVIADKVLVRPGQIFRERAGEATYNQFQALSSVNRTNVEYREGNYPDSTLLDCEIYLTPGNVHSLQTSLEGTHKAGDLGVALNIDYGHQNLFNGSEIFNIRLRGAYEFVSGKSLENLNNNYYEFGITPSLTFPKMHLPFVGAYIQEHFTSQTQYGFGLNIQKRPEYTRDFFNFFWKMRWSGRGNMVTHTLSLLDINFIFMPWKSSLFQDYLDNKIDALTKLSYGDIFTAGIGYNLIYTNAETGGVRDNLYTVRFNLETSGNLLQGLSSLFHAKKNGEGQYTIFDNPFAQYIKGDIDFSETFRLDQKSGLAFHAGVGVAVPFGNSTILPFEKRYYAGGPNSVRGWRTRYLGPGSFNQGRSGDPTTHVGDINFITSIEYRYKAMKWLEPAFFIDCGNIWTIKKYPTQEGGHFRWNRFYEQLAVGTGIGLRFDLSFLIFRIDGGTKVYDPARDKGNRFIFLKENFWKNSAFYFAIGYPF